MEAWLEAKTLSGESAYPPCQRLFLSTQGAQDTSVKNQRPSLIGKKYQLGSTAGQ